jgi:four helix bundle protein
MEIIEEKNPIKKKTYAFALKIIELYRILVSANEYVLSKQLLKAGTSIGANVEEAMAGQSRADFLSKMSIASKEARESKYWLRLIRDSKLIDEFHVNPLLAESSEIIRILTSIVKTTSSDNSSTLRSSTATATEDGKFKIKNS